MFYSSSVMGNGKFHIDLMDVVTSLDAQKLPFSVLKLNKRII